MLKTFLYTEGWCLFWFLSWPLLALSVGLHLGHIQTMITQGFVEFFHGHFTILSFTRTMATWDEGMSQNQGFYSI